MKKSEAQMQGAVKNISESDYCRMKGEQNNRWLFAVMDTVFNRLFIPIIPLTRFLQSVQVFVLPIDKSALNFPVLHYVLRVR